MIENYQTLPQSTRLHALQVISHNCEGIVILLSYVTLLSTVSTLYTQGRDIGYQLEEFRVSKSQEINFRFYFCKLIKKYIESALECRFCVDDVSLLMFIFVYAKTNRSFLYTPVICNSEISYAIMIELYPGKFIITLYYYNV